MKKETLHAYLRVSSDGQVKKDNSIPAQKKDAERKASQLGMNLVVMIEAGESASKETLENRPVLSQLLDMCVAGEVKHIFISEFDRIIRNDVVELEIKAILAKNKVLLHTTGQTIDYNDVEDEFLAGLLTLLAKREIKMKNKRSIRALRESASKGKVGGGVTIPYGYMKGEDKMMLIDPKESKVIERIFSESLSGKGSNTIAQGLNKDGVPTRGRKVFKGGLKVKNRYTGKVTHKAQEDLIWKPGTVMGVLKNPIYKGQRRYKGEIFSAPVIVPAAKWEAVQKNLAKNKAYSGGNEKKHFYLLKGLMRCGRCGRNFYGRKKTDENIYICSSKRETFCGCKSINIDRLNNLVWEAVGGSHHLVQQLNAEIHSGEKGKNQKIQELNKQLKALEAKEKEIGVREDNLISLYETGRITPQKFDIRNESLKGELANVSKEKDAVNKEIAFISRKERMTVLSTEYLKRLAGLSNVSDTDKQKLLNMLVKEITIDYDEKGKQHLIKLEVNVPNQEKAKEIWVTKSGKGGITFEDEQIARDYIEIAGRIVENHNKNTPSTPKKSPPLVTVSSR